MRKTLVLVASIFLVLAGCTKNGKDELTSNANLKLVDELKSKLYLDESFIKNREIDKKILSFKQDDRSSLEIEKVINDIQKCSTLTEILFVFKKNSIKNADSLLSFFDLKEKELLKIRERYPGLRKLSKEEFTSVWKYSYSRIGANELTMSMFKKGCTTKCCDNYVDAMSDCDDDFVIASAAAVGGAAVGAVFGGPIGAAGGLAIGMSAAYLQNQACTGRAVREYKKCMGYNTNIANENN